MPSRPPAILAIGRNYADHAREMGGQLDPNPIIFMKNPASVIGDGQAIEIPPICREHGPQVDYEGELAVEIGRDCRDVPEEGALAVVRAYRAANDVSARWWQKQGSGGQFCRGKSFDTFCPLGPWIETEFDWTDARLTCAVNGEVRQDSNVGDVVVGVPDLIAAVSAVMTLVPGDVILTGTPAGVGPIRGGDTVTVRIEGLGSLTNPVVDGG